MAVARVGKNLDLGTLERHRPRHRLVAQLTVELRDEFSGHLIVYLPECGQRTACTSPHSDPSQTQGCPVVSRGGVAGTERQEFERVLTVLEQSDELVEPVHGEPVVECKHKGLRGIVSKLPMR